MPTFFRTDRSSAPIPPREWTTVFRAPASPPPTGAVRVCDLIMEILLAALVLLTPVACGERAAWGMEIMGAAVTVMALALAVRCILTHRWPPLGRMLTIAMALFTALIVLQSTPLPKGLVRFLSPNAYALREALLKGLPGWEGTHFTTLTFYPLMTLEQLGMVVCLVTIFAAAVTVFQRREQVLRLLGAIAVAGFAVALFALAQHIFGYQQVYWISKPLQANCSPFGNYSQFSQFMNLSMASMMALLLLKPAGVEGRGARAITMALWAALGLSATMLILAVSRNGIISMVVAGACTIVALTLHRAIKWRTTLLLLGLAGILMLVFFFGFDVVYQRLASLSHPEVSYGKRWVILLSLVESWKKFPIFGTGLGTFEYIFPMFDRQIRLEARVTHAENEYAQMLTEMGALGLVPICLFIVEIARSYIRCIRRVRVPMTSAAVAMGFGLIAILIHSFTDFGQHAPGIACLTAIFSGLIFRTGRTAAPTSFGSAKTIRRSPAWWASWLIPAAIACCGVSYVLWEDHNRIGEHFYNRAMTIFDPETRAGLKDADYPRLAADAEAAARAQPQNVKFLYEAQMIQWEGIRHAAGADVAEVIPTQEVIDSARKIVAALHDARLVCPTFKPNYLNAAQIEAFVIVTPAAGDDFRKAVVTGDRDPLALFEGARYDLREHDAAAAADKLRRLDDTDSPRIVGLLLGGNVSNAIFMQVAEGKTFMLQILANMPDDQGGNAALRHDAAERLMALLMERCSRPDASASDLAVFAGICANGDHLPDALDAYQRALDKEPGNVEWRVEFARVLEKVGYHSEALAQARQCLALDPNAADAKQLLAELQSQ
jgi:O-antigen ligase/tetratricopeptide (TPR) repeat protein